MRDIIKTIDDSLEFQEEFFGSTNVCKVKKEGSFYILKFAYIGNQQSCTHIRNEAELLELAKNIEGITHLKQDYGRKGVYAAILKEYAEGKDLYDFGNKLPETHLQIQLEKTVKELHALDVANLDIRSINIVISSDRSSAKIVDLGHYTRKKDLGIFSSFKSLKKEDLRRLEKLFR